jgi:phage tail sheath protein FI
MAEYLTPGVHIEEIERGPRPIEGVPTSIAAFLGEAERGPTKPRLVTGYAEYKRWFGDVFGKRDRYLPYAASGFFENGGQRLYVCRIVGENAKTATLAAGDFTVSAVGPGEWGKRVWIRIEDSTTQTTENGNKVPVGFRIKAAYWSSFPDGFQPFDPLNPANRLNMPRPTLIEDWDDLVVDPRSPDFYEKRLTDNSALIVLALNAGADPKSRPAAVDGATLDGGADDPGDVGADDFVGDIAPGLREDLQGLAALELDPYRDVSLVYAPHPAVDPANIARKVVDHCERMRFRFAAMDAPRDATNVAALDPRTTLEDNLAGVDSEYAAFYYPWIRVSDPQNGALAWVPPGGHTLGVYARTDTERGVFKAPANEVVRGAVQLRIDINDAAQGQLNPRGVNVIRQFPGRGIRVWGGRTLSSNGLWKYVSVRRLFIFLERSIYENTQWVVFEPNDDRLWARVKDTIRLFLRAQWRAGALFGRTEDEAFFITIDRTTMSQDDILNGRLVAEIGIAPVRPAEFVIFRIFQNTAEAQR